MAKAEPKFELTRRGQQVVVEKIVAKSEERHWHDIYEIEFVASGEGTHILNGKEFDFKRGAIYITRLTDYHEKHLTHKGTIHRIKLPKYCMPEAFWRSMIRCKASLITQLSPEKAKHIENMFLLLESRPEVTSLQEKYIQECLLNVIVMLFTFEVNTNPGDRHIPDKNRIIDVMLYLQDNFRRKLTLKTVSEEMQLNANYLNNNFKKYTDHTLYAVIKLFRLNYGARLAVETDMMIKEICANCGYSDVNNFQRDFKKQYDCTPLEYREKKRAEADAKGEDYFIGEKYDLFSIIKK